MRYQSYLNTAVKIIRSYTGAEPLAAYLKKFFAAEKKYGSTDRKQIAGLCYNYYRLGKAVPGMLTEERIILATFLCEQSSSEFLKFHKPDWNEMITNPLTEKLLIINYQLLINDLFPYTTPLSDGIDQLRFATSFLTQPELFIRIRPGKNKSVEKKTEAAGLTGKQLTATCMAFPNATKLETILELDKEVIIQDYNSQQVLNFLSPSPPAGGELFKDSVFSIGHRLSVWDCCASSGGKSILAYDILGGKVELTVSDIRESILANLKKRFSAAGIRNYNSFIADLSTAGCQLPIAGCSLVICDAPCTGSGTWSRTPEQLYFFNPGMIRSFAERQKKIVSNAVTALQKGGLFFYITCSVFREENEAVVDFIKEKFHLQLLQMELLKGYDKKADSMFTAVFMK